MNNQTEKPVEWVDAEFFLPRGANLPVEVELDDGRKFTWTGMSHDWRPVKRWRSLDLTGAALKQARKEETP